MRCPENARASNPSQESTLAELPSAGDDWPKHRRRRRSKLWQLVLGTPGRRSGVMIVHVVAHCPAPSVKTFGALDLNPSAIAFYNRKSRAAPVIHLVAACFVKSREREDHGAVRNLINQKMHQNRCSGKRVFRPRDPGNFQVVG